MAASLEMRRFLFWGKLMRIHADIAALRRNDTPQRRAQAAMHDAMAQWRDATDADGLDGAGSSPAAVLADLDRLSRGAHFADCAALARLFADAGAARRFADGYAARMLGVLAENPLGQVATRHHTDGTSAMLLFGRVGEASLMLCSVDGAGFALEAAPEAVAFRPAEIWEVVLAGAARGMVLRIEGVREDGTLVLAREPMLLRPGTILVRDSLREVLLLESVETCLVTLKLQLQRENARTDAGGAEPVREVELVSGRITHQSAATPVDSRRELMVALLGRMGRADAAPAMSRIAREPGADGLRWQALKECLALDTAQGFAALTAMARDAGDPLAAHAGALRAQLVESWPQLEMVACPA